MGHYITELSLTARISATVARRIYDDDNDGEPDVDPVEQLIADAERWFESVAIAVYPDLTALRTSGGEVAQLLVLDCAQAMACQRFPRAFGRDWEPLMEWADKQLMRLRKGEIKLPVQGAPNPPANTGGNYSAVDAITGVQCGSFTRNGFGMF